MPNFTVYNARTGEIRCTGTQATIEWCHAQAGPGESVYLGSAQPGSYIRNGVPEPLPPKPDEHHVFDWAAHAWRDPRTPDDLRTQLKADLAEQRWNAETSGLALANGLRIKTAREDRAALTEQLASMASSGLERIDFKAADGFVTLTSEQVQAVSRAVADHVQRCFSAERAACAFVDGLGDAEIPARCSLADFMGLPPTDPSFA
ncbi:MULTISPECIES: DUF4376 domain-containing protein [unclassified Variovorax]|uniref:DUF4376 domain-containing protein n=1 Tax=unclassified Variovorax TaxID=663243 RepID=UPI0008D3999C|nr:MULTISPECIES: DUF4376 domain-containing protein [unclassified Variovorax]SEJ95550.1 protein of unknown function [Variovorax sp. OK202]SFD19385.1 protein of unknown function [Variovorax sp. OK212]